jgi:hypothetical protein
LELLQSFVERRAGGETGVDRVELLTGEAFATAIAKGRWSRSLVDAAIRADSAIPQDRQPWPTQPGSRPQADPSKPTSAATQEPPPQPVPEHALIVTYRDGLQGTVLKVGSSGNRWAFACRLDGESETQATALYNGPWGNRGLFKALSHAIQHLFVRREEPYPIERTLLVSGILDAAMRSHHEGGRVIDTPHLKISYPAAEARPFREFGQTWRHITLQTPQPYVFTPGDQDYLKVD